MKPLNIDGAAVIQRDDARLVNHLVAERHVAGPCDLVAVVVTTGIIEPIGPREMQRS
jgi:hypothetical protein